MLYSTHGNASIDLVEWVATDAAPTCRWYATFGGSGSDLKYSVIRSNLCSTCWYGFIDGSLQFTSGALGFSTADYVYAGGEFNTQLNSETIGGLTYGGYAIYPADTPWQRTSDVYGGNVSWTTINQSLQVNTDGHWNISAPPSPFSVSH